MLFFSPYAAFRVGIRSELVQYHPTTGVELSRTPALRAEFGRLGGEYSYFDQLTNKNEVGAVIHGNYFDTDAAAEEQRWSDDEKESVENRLVWLCGKRPDLIKHVEFHAPVVMAPWPTYDQADVDAVLTFAPAAGLAREALEYERLNKQRPAVIEALEKLIAEAVGEDGEPLDDHELTNVVVPPREKLEPARGGETRGAIMV